MLSWSWGSMCNMDWGCLLIKWLKGGCIWLMGRLEGGWVLEGIKWIRGCGWDKCIGGFKNARFVYWAGSGIGGA